ncbi:hypothetical protein F5882DRAFT_313162 [Hyaloscypha sp. PMI_1271]|nr:hypothetical protein F5882DRAFT_313162 [Hyaloscypha sp. PMI_1271]
MAELLIDHRFLDKALLQEALTYPSYKRDTLTKSYYRLEFLGDIVLDMIIVTATYATASNKALSAKIFLAGRVDSLCYQMLTNH